MRDTQANIFEDTNSPCSVGESPREIDVKEYGDLQKRLETPLRVLFLSSDSIISAKNFVAKGAVEFTKGLLVRHKKNVYDMPNISEDDHLTASFTESFNSGGERAVSGMLAAAEEGHIIQAAVDVNKNARLDKHFNVRSAEVAQRIKEIHPDVFHFSGHIKKEKGLVFCRRDASNRRGFINEYMNKECLKSCFTGETVLLAIIVSCNSAVFAQELVESGVARIAIGTDSEICDDSALRFVERFYGELSKIGNMTREDFVSSVQKAYAFAVKENLRRKCPMHIFPEIPIGKATNGAMKNKIYQASFSPKSPLIEIKSKVRNQYQGV